MISYDNLWNIMKEKGITHYVLVKQYSGAVGAIPHTERYPHFVDETIEGVNRSGRG